MQQGEQVSFAGQAIKERRATQAAEGATSDAGTVCSHEKKISKCEEYKCTAN
jgi:hypothetical protein